MFTESPAKLANGEVNTDAWTFFSGPEHDICLLDIVFFCEISQIIHLFTESDDLVHANSDALKRVRSWYRAMKSQKCVQETYT